MRFLHLARAACAAAALSSSVLSQTFPEVEPNSVKTEATPVVGIAAGGAITGTTTGSDTTAGSTIVTTADVFRVRTGALPLGLYEHRLTLTSDTVGHTGSIRGLNQTGTPGVGGTPGVTDLEIQTSQITSTPPRYNKWYGFGKQEEIYYRVIGSGATAAAYGATLTTTPITPTVIAPPFESGSPITISTVGLTFVDTEILLYDASWNPVAVNDHEYPGTSAQSKLTRTLAPGVYYLAVSRFELCSDQPAPPDDNFVAGWMTDFPDCVVLSDSSTLSQDFDFSIRACNGLYSQVNQSPANNPFEVTWFQFTAAPGAPPVSPLSNDACASATPLTAPTTLVGSLSSATNDGVASCDPGGAAAKDVWYSFTNASGGPSQLTVNTCGTTDTVLTVFTSCGGAELACSDDCAGAPCAGPGSCVSVSLATSQNVIIRVSNKGIAACDYTLTLNNAGANDDCALPANITGYGNFPINSFGATTGTQGQTEALCLFFGSTTVAQDVWYTWTALNNGTVEVTTCGGVAGGPSQDSKIAVYNGNGCPTGPAIACNDDSVTTCSAHPFNARVFFNAVCGNTYTFQIGMYPFSTQTLNGTFSVTLTAPGGSCTVATPFCEGSSVGTTCLGCGNNGAAGRGCANSAFVAGTQLAITGLASIANDTLVLNATDIPGPGLYFQANGLIAPTTFGDGMLCAGVGIIRMGVVFPTPTFTSSYPGGLTPNPIHIAGGPISAGDLKHYQVWYRDAVVYCTTSTFNTSNGISLTWAP